MPCNGVAVASGTINEDLAKLLETIPYEAIRNDIVAVLQATYPQVAGAEIERLPWGYDLGTVDMGFKLDRFLFQVSRSGRVTVSSSIRRANAAEIKLTTAMQKTIADTLLALGGLALQNRVKAQLQQAGVVISGQQTAPNGALVFSVEV